MIKLTNVVAGYEDREVLHGVSMAFEPGKVTALIGPNGCGKSTLLKALVRINPHSGGEISVDTVPVEKYKPNELAKKVAYLAQSKNTPDISVLRMVLHGRFAYLSYPRRYREEDYTIARKALKWAGLEGMEEENVNRLSGGLQQKVYIAMALAQDAATILMDEPTTYLDVSHQLRLMEMARKLAAEGKAVVMVLHDLSQALRTADEVVVLQNGQIAAMGTPEAVYESGKLQEVFGIEIERVRTKSGLHYLCDSGLCGDNMTEWGKE